MFSLDGYRALRTTGGVVKRTDRGVLSITGRDRATWLQGLVTNDVLSLGAGQSCYAAYLTPQGRMITDMNVVADAGRLLLDVPAPLAAALRERLDGLIFAEDTQVTDESAALQVLEVYGGGKPLGLPNQVLILARAARPPDLPEVDLDTFEVFRIEEGIPRFLVDMTDDTIPLEAGIEDRAISFTKGCYVGQEVIVRVTHRGGGRVAKKLVKWRAGALAPAGAKIVSGDRDIGRVTSAALSPALDRVVGLGYVHRDFVEKGTSVTLVWDDSHAEAVVA
ncbi:MAG: glycine cleavage T C-terminal barrel domain-containing protein [Vicinamibacterales bacterium]